MQLFFLTGQAGALFAVYWPSTQANPQQAVIHVPAFAEEMNKSRRMVALQAKALAEMGCAVLVLDLFGTGDSEGDFAEASWDIWLSDLAVGIAWLKTQGISQVDLWGLRTGALLAVDFIKRNPGEIERLWLWQPVMNGDTFVTQFLRLRVAAAMMNGGAPQEKTGNLKMQLKQGQILEVAGYALHPDLINPLMGVRSDVNSFTSLRSIEVFEIIAGLDVRASPVIQQWIDKCVAAGVAASLQTVVGDSFWVSQEITTAPILLAAMQGRMKACH